MRVVLPVVFRFKLVKVLLLILAVAEGALLLLINSGPLVLATEKTIPRTSLLLIDTFAVIVVELVTAFTAPLVAALKVMALPLALPIWLLFRFSVVTTGP